VPENLSRIGTFAAGATETFVNPRIPGQALLDESSRFMAGKAALVPLPLGLGPGLLWTHLLSGCPGAVREQPPDHVRCALRPEDAFVMELR
jgi:hypothetical protein